MSLMLNLVTPTCEPTCERGHRIPPVWSVLIRRTNHFFFCLSFSKRAFIFCLFVAVYVTY